mmetsp:Transcript_6426/g.14273  ORF Transcript_6426/g.14273 Transcript_6426/m.14273 type:complete len:112 (+) Transcript_6426:1680-2015(+)
MVANFMFTRRTNAPSASYLLKELLLAKLKDDDVLPDAPSTPPDGFVVHRPMKYPVMREAVSNRVILFPGRTIALPMILCRRWSSDDQRSFTSGLGVYSLFYQYFECAFLAI